MSEICPSLAHGFQSFACFPDLRLSHAPEVCTTCRIPFFKADETCLSRSRIVPGQFRSTHSQKWYNPKPFVNNLIRPDSLNAKPKSLVPEPFIQCTSLQS